MQIIQIVLNGCFVSLNSIFLLYYIVTIIYKDLVIEGIYSVVFGSWFPLILFLPIGVFLTYKAARDSALFDMYSYSEPIKKIFKKTKK